MTKIAVFIAQSIQDLSQLLESILQKFHLKEFYTGLEKKIET